MARLFDAALVRRVYILPGGENQMRSCLKGEYGVAGRAARTGVGGWLALLIAWLILLRPLSGIYLWTRMHGAAEGDPSLRTDSSLLVNTSTFWLIFLTSAALSIYGGVRLLRERTPAAVHAAIVLIWLAVPLSSLAGLISRAYLDAGVSLPRAIADVVIHVAVAAVWTAYLLRSRRVKNTYHSAGA